MKLFRKIDENPHKRVKKPAPLLQSYLAFYNGQMETIEGRYFTKRSGAGPR